MEASSFCGYQQPRYGTEIESLHLFNALEELMKKKIAINTVMAGAKPECLPVIIAAIEPGFRCYPRSDH
jgi:hypothetical protein